MKMVGYPGIRGTFSDEAGRMYFDSKYDGIGLGTFEEVCRALKKTKKSNMLYFQLKTRLQDQSVKSST